MRLKTAFEKKEAALVLRIAKLEDQASRCEGRAVWLREQVDELKEKAVRGETAMDAREFVMHKARVLQYLLDEADQELRNLGDSQS